MPDPLWPLRELWLARQLARAQRGDRDAFRQLYRALYPVVWRFVRRRAQSDAAAEELLGQVFFQLLEALPRIDPSRGVRGYVLTIARNALVDEARRTQRAAPGELAEQQASLQPGALELLTTAEETARLGKQLATLPEQTREWLLLRFEDGLRFAEIAQLTGASEAAVRQRVSRAVRELRGNWPEELRRGPVRHET